MKTQGEILGHPKGLFVLFFTEMWERFSFYGMRALLVLYMVNYLFFQPERSGDVLGYDAFRSVLEGLYGPLTVQAFSSHIYGLYTGFVYLTPFFGGLIADRLIGQRKSVYIGGIFMAIGHLLMASERHFFPALLFLVVGNGFFKPNISSQVGALYPEGDPRRDRAFTIFYMGVNLGAFLSPLVCGSLGQYYGWHYGFAAAGIGMLVGLVVYHFGRHLLPVETRRIVVKNERHVPVKLTVDEKRRILGFVILCIINVLFWSVYEQQGNTLQLWADRNTDWVLLGREWPSTWYQSMNPLIIITMAPVITQLWAWQNRRKKEPGSVSKMAIGCTLAAVGFLVMALAVEVNGTEGKGSLLWLTSATFLFTIGELYLSPIGLSLVTKVAPVRMVSMLMGVWFLSSFFGNYLAGWIGAHYETLGPLVFFYVVAALAGLGALLFILAGKPLKKSIGHDI